MTPIRNVSRLFAACAVLGSTLVLASSSQAATSRTHGFSPVPPLDHIIVVVMENKSYDTVRVLPYTASLIAKSSSFAESYAVAHPSQPNYIALWCANTLGVTSDACPQGPWPYENLGQACEAAGLRWRAYSENLPATGSPACTASGTLYTRKHDPWTNFNNNNHDNERVYSDLAADIANDSVPNLAFVIPNNCNNSHDTGSGCTAAVGDTWLSNNMPAMLQAVGPRGIVMLTWDEDDFSSSNHILTVFSGALVDSGYVSPRRITHYTVVRTICDALGLPPMSNASVDSSITDIWRPDPLAVGPAVGAGIQLSAVIPNPGSSMISVRLDLPRTTRVDAAIFDLEGRPVRTLVHGARSGQVTMTWDRLRTDGRRAQAGMYFLRVQAGAKTFERKITLLK